MSVVMQKPWFKLVLGLALIGVAWGIYQLYPFLLFQVMTWQKSFNLQLSEALKQLQEHSQQTGFSLLIISFLYGVFHAVGPGHGKFILTSYLALEKTKLTQAMKISLLSALVQGGVAVLLVSVIVVAFTLSRSYFNLTLQWVERGSFALMLLFGLYWGWAAFKQIRPKSTKPKIRAISGNMQKTAKISPLASHQIQADGSCSCGHQHLPDSQQLTQANDWKSLSLIILSIGARPCSGAILVLFLSYTLDLYGWGVLSAFAMAVGTGLTLSLFAWLVLIARKQAVLLSGWYLSRKGMKQAAIYLKIALALALILFGFTLLHGSFMESVSNGLLKR